MNAKATKTIRALVYATAGNESPEETRARYQGVKQAFLDLPRDQRAAYLGRIKLAAQTYTERQTAATSASQSA